MDGAWYVFLRDIMIIVAAASLLVTLLFVSIVAWQLYKFAMEFREEVSPIVVALQDTAETVRDTSDFIGTRLVVPATDATASAADSAGILKLLARFTARETRRRNPEYESWSERWRTSWILRAASWRDSPSAWWPHSCLRPAKARRCVRESAPPPRTRCKSRAMSWMTFRPA
jgi:hypothetical protein